MNALGSVIVIVLALGMATAARAADDGAAQRAWVRVVASEKSKHPIPRLITGKFAEHLGSNIYNGMSAQVLRNPTFADFPFWTGGTTPDGRTTFHSDEQRIADTIRQLAGRMGYRGEQVTELIDSRKAGLAFWWSRVGPGSAVKVSADAGPHGGRAQRVEVQAAGQGIAQRAHLPLHRVRKYEYELVIRSPDLASLELAIGAEGRPRAAARVEGIARKWQTLRGAIEIAAGEPDDALYQVALTAPGAGQFVIARLLLWPADHIKGADPDVVRLLKDSKLPILRWPGGNFVSGYHWEEGIGPMEARPTVPNWAWGGVEPNLFGTDEFIAFCRAVGCEPMICVNAGDGTPAEAARWIEYCNGSVNTPMGAKRAANGHPEPYNVKYWEVGNELWGSWQVHGTTPRGYVDRYREFSEAMLAADTSVTLYACGAPVLWGKNWNDTLITGTADIMTRTTDHPLIGGNVSAATEPIEVYRSFMGVPEVLERKWGELRKSMESAGIKDPRLAVTELQLFAHIAGRRETDGPAKLTGANLVNPATQAEGLYNTLLYHSVIRLAPFVDMVTHSATVNHGGGLHKQRERVYADPCHHAQAMFAAFGGAVPVATHVDSPAERVAMVLPDVKGSAPQVQYSAIAALGAVDGAGELLVSLVHRGAGGPIQVTVDLEGFAAAPRAEVITLSADVPWARNTVENPRRVHPVETTVEVADGKVIVTLAPYTVARLRIPAAK